MFFFCTLQNVSLDAARESYPRGRVWIAGTGVDSNPTVGDQTHPGFAGLPDL